MSYYYRVLFLEQPREFIESLGVEDKAKVLAHITAIAEGDFNSIHTKPIKPPLRELIVKHYRVFFCIKKDAVYLLRAFVKKSAKTPRKEIVAAERAYRLVVRELYN